MDVQVTLYSELPRDILSALLWESAEWRDVSKMDTLIRMGADPHQTYEDFSVLEMFMHGHDGYWRHKNSVEIVEQGVKMLSEHGVSSHDIHNPKLLENISEIIDNSEYLKSFVAPRVA